MATYTLKAGTSWNDVWARCRAVAPEAFDVDRSRNLVAGQWVASGEVAPHQLSIDGSQIAGPPLIDEPEAQRAIAAATAAHREWGRVSLDERRARVAKAVELLSGQRELLALLLVWEIGKPWRLACADVDRALDGVRWYLGEIERQLQGRAPLPGPVSNIASWNYPMSVLVHAELVQLLAGNAVVSKTPSQGGFHCLTLAHAMLHRAGLPVTLVSGTGARIGSTLVRGPGLGALAFVGGRANGRRVALDLADTGRRYMLEEEGLNAWGVWDFSNWAELGAHLKKGFEYGKQRCTAYPRYVVQRRLLPEFLEMYLGVVGRVRFGHPLAVERPDDDFPELDFGPVISASKAVEMGELFASAVGSGGAPVARRLLEHGRFLPGQDTSGYVPPACVLEPPASWELRHREPFGPLDSIVLVDTETQWLAEMNVSNGALVASIATDDLGFAARIRDEIRAFKVGINKPRSRGDREEVFGGRGASWRGAFVGGDLLVAAVTHPRHGGPDELYGNFEQYSRYPVT
ncbi:MAG: aldehyde dehydrogenase family protein [Deltaproteobacteria bacterium]|jgi:acyl-CoA reductase-like NAD-dependent aldehyde dehydrogenase|nr:aldehyde dehydrogenase family protein [Deltaproteobacteria bacterium]